MVISLRHWRQDPFDISSPPRGKGLLEKFCDGVLEDSMTTRRTSIEAYEKIKANGLLSKRRFETYTALFRHGPATTSELIEAIRADNPGRDVPMTRNLHRRLGELVERGVAYEVRERKCRITNHTVIEYDVTDGLPVQPKKKKSELEVSRERVAYLEAQVESLRAQIRRMGGTVDDVQADLFGARP